MEKKLLVVLVLVGLCSAVALAMDPMGPPTAEIGKGKWSIGPMYSYSEMDIERQQVGGSWGSNNPRTETKIKVHKAFANLGYGLADNVDAFVRLGVANLHVDGLIGGGHWKGGEGDWNFIWGGGVKATLVEAPDVSWGFLVQFSEGDLGGDEKGQGDEEGNKATYEVQLHEMQIAFGPTWKAAEGLKIYGGPFVNLIRGRWQDEIEDYKPRKPIEEENWLGGYIGTEIDLAQNTNFTVEGQFTVDGWAVAGGIVFKQ